MLVAEMATDVSRDGCTQQRKWKRQSMTWPRTQRGVFNKTQSSYNYIRALSCLVKNWDLYQFCQLWMTVIEGLYTYVVNIICCWQQTQLAESAYRGWYNMPSKSLYSILYHHKNHPSTISLVLLKHMPDKSNTCTHTWTKSRAISRKKWREG